MGTEKIAVGNFPDRLAESWGRLTSADGRNLRTAAVCGRPASTSPASGFSTPNAASKVAVGGSSRVGMCVKVEERARVEAGRARTASTGGRGRRAHRAAVGTRNSIAENPCMKVSFSECSRRVFDTVSRGCGRIVEAAASRTWPPPHRALVLWGREGGRRESWRRRRARWERVERRWVLSTGRGLIHCQQISAGGSADGPSGRLAANSVSLWDSSQCATAAAVCLVPPLKKHSEQLSVCG